MPLIDRRGGNRHKRIAPVQRGMGRDMNVKWNKCQDDKWCPFLTLNLENTYFRRLNGVYVIWHGGKNPRTVYVGKGSIANRIRSHRHDDKILKFSYLGLFVTWAQVPRSQQDGVVRYLISTLKPLVHSGRSHLGERTQVNFSW